MKLEQLIFFSEAVKYNSISIAAEQNFISQPAFSSAITKLEKELGVTLLRRNSRGVQPTEAGAIILEKVRDIIGLVGDIQDIAYSHGQQGVVKLSTIPCMCDQILPIAMRKMNEQNTPFSLSISCAESHEVYHNVLSGMVPLGVLFYCEDINSPEIRYTRLFEDEYVLYVGPQSPYWDAESITIEEAMRQPYIAYREEFIKNNGGLSDTFNGLVPNIYLRTDELESIKKMISLGNYAAFFHKIMTQDDIYLRAGLIRPLTISNFNTRTEVGYIESTKYKPSSIDRMFIETLKSAVEDIFKTDAP